MPDTLTRLRGVDPATAHREQTQAPPPAHVLERIVATPPRTASRRRLLPAGAAVAVAALAAVAFLVFGGSNVDLAARAYAATEPGDAVIYSRSTITNSGPEQHHSITRITEWQRGDRMHNVMEVDQDGKHWRYEHDQRGPVFRTLSNGKVDAIRSDDPGWKNDEGTEGFADNLRTVVERFRARYRGMRDAGDATFNGRPARAYASDHETFYVDRETALPLGSVSTFPVYAATIDPKTRKPIQGERTGDMTITETVDDFERLPVTDANLALLDAPAIDAAQQ